MEFTKMRTSYSYIGDFVHLLIHNEQRIKNMMLDYEIQSKIDKLPNGQEVKSLLFTNKNISVRFLPARIDYTFSYPNQTLTNEAVFNTAKQFFKLLGEIFYDCKGSRIAVVHQVFLNNNDNMAIDTFASKMGLVQAFGNCNELSMKINTPKFYKEPLNSVLNIDMGEAKNNKTQEKMKILILNMDVNTLSGNLTPRFTPSNFEEDFKDLFAELEGRCIELSKY